MPRVGKRMRAVVYTTLVFVLAITAAVNYYPWMVSGKAWGVVEFEVQQGSGAGHVADMLFDRGLIVNRDVFVAGAVLLGIDRKFVAGKYVLPPRLNIMSLYEVLQTGQRHLNLVTIPEGLTILETSRVLAEKLDVEAEALKSWGADPELLSELGIAGDSVEGFLFPDTYDIPEETHPRDIVSTMVKRAISTFDSALAGAESPPELSRNEVFTLASIVEAEVTYLDEAPRVAAVFLNRLRVGMPLQADPTVAYALGERKQRITYRDLEVESPYNTYMHGGLPPGPICSPGENSIAAVLNPRLPSKEMYFVARGDGRHVFSETIDEHIRAKRNVRARLRDERRRREAEEITRNPE
jgi:UPF0755 protein